MKIFCALIVAMMAMIQANAKTLVIADIDDTLKNAHVLEMDDALFNAGKTQNLVLGTDAVLRAMVRNDPSTKIYYVTNAPKFMMEKNHRAFLVANSFPAGELRLRQNPLQSDFKLEEIRRILKKENPDVVISLGDNGEKDIFIYEQIQSEFPKASFLTYIRQPYSIFTQGVPLHAQQVGFVTGLDLMVHLRNQGLIQPAEALNFVGAFAALYEVEDPLADNGPMAIPAWMDCRSFSWSAMDSDLLLLPAYVRAKSHLLQRCSLSPLTD